MYIKSMLFLNRFKTSFVNMCKTWTECSEPEFLSIWYAIQLKVRVQGFSLFVLIFLMIKHLTLGIWTAFRPVEIYTKEVSYQQTKNVACTSPAVFSDLWKESSSRKVDFSASSNFLRIQALELSHSLFSLRMGSGPPHIFVRMIEHVLPNQSAATTHCFNTLPKCAVTVYFFNSFKV